MRFLILTLLLVSCGLFKTEKPKDDKLSDETRAALQERVDFFCAESEALYNANKGNVDEIGRCDGPVFTSLHSLICDYATVSQFESKDEPGKLCRDPECRCFYKDLGSKSGFAKDGAISMQLALTVHPDPDLVDRIIDYGEENSWVVCDAINEVEKASTCLMSPKIVGRWYDLQGRGRLVAQKTGEGEAIGVNTGSEANLDIISIMGEYKLYGAISPTSKRTIKEQWSRVKINGLFHASYSRFIDNKQAEVAARSLLAKFPSDRLPNSRNDWCEQYLWRRDPAPKDWDPCPSSPVLDHSATDFLFAAWVLLKK